MTGTRHAAGDAPRVTVWLRSRGCQAAAVVLAFLAVAALNRQTDGLWFQGDAPRHAANGLFWWDFLTSLPRHPLEYAVSYYARYPVIAPATYPPLFYLLEGLAFAVLGPTPYAARLVVLLFGVLAGLYTMAWCRRWVGPPAGWVGAFLAFMPGMVTWSNAVMLNVPATALGLALLYHFRRWLETARTKPLVLAALFATAVLLTYYPGASALAVVAAWAVPGGRDLRVDRRFLWVGAAALVVLAPLAAALLLAPVQTSRHLPTLAFLGRPTTWTYYWHVLPGIAGRPALALGLAGCAAGLASARWRVEALFLVTWIAGLITVLSLLPARDPRYILLVLPAFGIAATIGLACTARYLPPLDPRWQGALLAAGLAAGVWSAGRVAVPRVSGFRQIAAYLRERAPNDAVLYDGDYDGLFGFYVRALDPTFRRRVVLADRLLYYYGPGPTFAWIQTSNVATTDDVVTLIRGRSGCRWVAIELAGGTAWALGRRLLRQAVKRPAFELVGSFPIAGAGQRRVDLYRVAGSVEPVHDVDLTLSVPQQSTVSPRHSDRPVRQASAMSPVSSRVRPGCRFPHQAEAHQLRRVLQARRRLAHEGQVGIPVETLCIASVLGRPVVVLAPRGFPNGPRMKVVQELEMQKYARVRCDPLRRNAMSALEVA